MATNFITPRFELDLNADKYFIKKGSSGPPPGPVYETITLTPIQCGRFLIIDEDVNSVYTKSGPFEDLITNSSETTIWDDGHTNVYTNVQRSLINPDTQNLLIGDIKVVIK